MKTKTRNKPRNNSNELQRVNDLSTPRMWASLKPPVRQLKTTKQHRFSREKNFPAEGAADRGRAGAGRGPLAPPAAGAREGGSPRRASSPCAAASWLENR